MSRFWLATVLLAANLAWAAAPAAALEIKVTNAGDDDAGCTLREAIQAANADSTSFAPGCTAGSGTDTIVFSVRDLGSNPTITIKKGEIFLSSNLTIQGPATITANKTSRIFRMGSAYAVNLVDLTLTEGKVDGSGAALLVEAGSAVVDIHRCRFTYNEVVGGRGSVNGHGGAISSSGDLTLRETEFQDNKAGRRGGAVYGGGKITVEDTHFFGNYAGWGGGGLYCTSGELTVKKASSFHLNIAAGQPSPSGPVDGGGGLGSGCKTTVTESLFLRNMVFGPVGGGGILLESSADATVTRSVFRENYAGSSKEDEASIGGGGIHARGQLVADRNVFWKNTVKGFFGGGGILFSNSKSTVVNSAFLGNVSTLDNFSPKDPEVGTPPATPSNGAAISATGTSLVQIIASSLNANQGDSEIFFTLGTGEIVLRNTLIGGELTTRTCDGDLLKIVNGPNGSGGHNMQSKLAPDPSCLDVPVKELALTGATGSFGVMTLAGPLDFPYWKPGAGSEAIGQGEPSVCTGMQVLSRDLLDKPRPDLCAVGALEP